MKDDDLTAIPSISATRDEESGMSSRDIPRRYQDAPGLGIFYKLLSTISLVAVVVALLFAWQFHRELDRMEVMLDRYAARTGDLEDLLSDTDETVNQSAVAMRVQLKRLDTENRKLWDARKVSNKRISELEETSSSQEKRLIALIASVEKSEEELPVLQEKVARFTSLAKDLTNLTASARRNQSEVERVADGINRIDLEQTKLSKRVSENEGWIESINAFRRQTNGKLTQLETTIQSQQAPEVQTNSD